VEEAPPELVEIYDRENLRPLPQNVPGVTWSVKESREDLVGGKAGAVPQARGPRRQFFLSLLDVVIEAELTTPRDARKQACPVIVEFFPFEFRGRFPPPPSPTWQEQVIARGWAYAILSTSTIQADNGAGLTKGIIGLVNKGQPRKPDDWGALRAWAWGASRLLDHLETLPEVDAKRAVIEGCPRFGKAALVTMAYEPRYAIGFIGSSGAGGAALARRNWGEKLENVAGSGEYHWMAGNYIRYAAGSAGDERSARGRARTHRAGCAAAAVHRRRHAGAG
jgi:hypothetical protein